MYMVKCSGIDTHGHTLVVSLSQSAVGVAAMTIHYAHKEMVSSGGGNSH